MNSNFLETTRNISENYFLNFYFLNVDTSLTMYDLDLKLHICVQNIVIVTLLSMTTKLTKTKIRYRYIHVPTKIGM